MIRIKRYGLILLFMWLGVETHAVEIKKKLLYDRHTLSDTYKYGKQERRFQWDKISAFLDSLVTFQERNDGYGVLRNYKNQNGEAPLTEKYITNKQTDILKMKIKSK